MDNEIGKTKILFSITNDQDDYLKAINENKSEALRTVIKEHMWFKKRTRLERNLMYVVFGMCIIILFILLLPFI